MTPDGHLIFMAPLVPRLNSVHCTASPQYIMLHEELI